MSWDRRVPFTEIFERTMDEIVRDGNGNVTMEQKYKGFVNDVYLTDFLTMLPEDVLRKQANLTTIADYSEGLISVDAGDSAVTGDGDCDWTSANSNDALLKASGEEALTRVTYKSITELTLTTPSTWVDDDVDDEGYRLLFDRFALASDFSHMVIDDESEPEAVFWWSHGSKQFLIPKDNGEFDRDFMFDYGIPAHYTVKRIVEDPYLYIWPCDTIARSLHYYYIPALQPLYEKTGTATSTAASTSITGVTGLASEAWINTTEDFFFRFDADGVGQASRWYKISALAGTTVTLASAYTTTRSASNYTISSVSRYPLKYDRALIYGAALRVDPDAKDATRWASIYGGLMPGFTKLYNTRIHGRKMSYKRGG